MADGSHSPFKTLRLRLKSERVHCINGHDFYINKPHNVGIYCIFQQSDHTAT